MVLRTAFRRLRQLNFLRPRLNNWGIKESLFTAFAIIAGIAVLISVGAGMILGQLGGMMQDLGGRDIPRLAASLQLAARSADLASQGPAVLASRDEAELTTELGKVKELQDAALAKLGEIIELGADKSTVEALQENVKNIDDTVKSLGNAAKERLDLATRHQQLYEELRTRQAAFVAAANPAMMAAQANINAILTSANTTASLSTKLTSGA